MKPFCMLPLAYLILTVAAGADELHPADLRSSSEAGLTAAAGDTIEGGVAKNACGEIVHPRIAELAPDQWVEQETGGGACSGSEPPDTITVVSRSGSRWKLEQSTTGSGFHLGDMVDGHPDILVDDPPGQRGCPVIRWNGSAYAFYRACPR